MQGTMDIMAMVQKSSMVRQKASSTSFRDALEKGSFEKELLEARKSTAYQKFDNNVSEPVKQEAFNKDNKAEKLAKAMSGTQMKNENIQDASKTEITETKDLAKLEETDDVKVDKALEEEIKPETEKELMELAKSAEEILQQLMLIINGTSGTNEAEENVKQLIEALEVVTQKLEQIISATVETKTDKEDLTIKDLKVELKELLKQLKTQSNETQPEVLVKQDVQNTVRTIKHLINKMNEIKPEVQQRLSQTDNVPETGNTTKDSKAAEIKVETSAAEKNPTDESTAINKVTASSAKESTVKDSKQEDKESQHNSESKEIQRTAAAGEKQQAASFRDFVMPQQDKAAFQINLKEMNLNVKKDEIFSINKSDIVNQVVKKADIIIREGHSEMIMKLEPESLGKLNLKIVVEKGLITAKFIAESQQVKEVLESSFNQLKDALQEKGISVQSFSVSVGQQAGDPNSNQSFNQWKQSIKLKNKAVGEFMELDDQAVINQNPYNYHEGKVDYRA